jgi:hypothetical protein
MKMAAPCYVQGDQKGGNVPAAAELAKLVARLAAERERVAARSAVATLVGGLDGAAALALSWRLEVCGKVSTGEWKSCQSYCRF